MIAEVHVKYLDLRRLDAKTIILALTGANGYTVSTDAYGTTTITETATGSSALLGGPDADGAPSAFLNYYLTDRDRNVYTSDYKKVEAEAAITSGSDLGGGNNP